MNKIFLDNQSTTCIDPAVLKKMLPWFTEKYGNPASKSHSFGWEANEAIDIARKQVANIIAANSREIIFTSGSTESNNLVLNGIINSSSKNNKKHIISVKTEHKSILDPLDILEKNGLCDITYLNVHTDGIIDLNKLKDSINENTILISIMYANNEIGVIQPIEKIGEFCKNNNILFHTDAAQAIGKIPVNVDKMNIDLLSFSSHKLYGPKGIGALFIKNKSPKINITPQIYGGGHEMGIRSGTLPVPLIVGFGKACSIANQHMTTEIKRIEFLKKLLLNGLSKQLNNISINGNNKKCIPGNLNLCFKNIDAMSLLMNVSEIALSMGSACTSSKPESSHVLKAIGLSNKDSLSSIRFGIGRFNTEEEIKMTILLIINAVNKLRKTKKIKHLNIKSRNVISYS